MLEKVLCKLIFCYVMLKYVKEQFIRAKTLHAHVKEQYSQL